MSKKTVVSNKYMILEIVPGETAHAYFRVLSDGPFVPRLVKVDLAFGGALEREVRRLGVDSLLQAQVGTVDDPFGKEPPLWGLEKIEQVLFDMGKWIITCKETMNEVAFDPEIKGRDKLLAFDQRYPYSDKKGPHHKKWAEARRALHLFIDSGVLPGAPAEEKSPPKKELCRCPMCYGYGKIEKHCNFLICPCCGEKLDDRRVKWVTKADEPTEVECTKCARLFRAERYKFEVFVSRTMSPWDAAKE